MSNSRKTETSSSTRSLNLLDSFDSGGFFDLGHPLLNRIADSFFKIGAELEFGDWGAIIKIGAIQAVSRQAYFTANIEGAGLDSGGGIPPEISGAKKHRFRDLKGETNRKSLEAMVVNAGKESLQWGLAAGVYNSGLTYGLKEARGAHAKNSAVAGAITGVTLAVLTCEEGSSHEQIVQCAITGAAIYTAANLLKGIF